MIELRHMPKLNLSATGSKFEITHLTAHSVAYSLAGEVLIVFSCTCDVNPCREYNYNESKIQNKKLHDCHRWRFDSIIFNNISRRMLDIRKITNR